ncbi:MAG: NAD(P)/FAD-dependent oxidoreductase [Clostridia bacterium]|nr:NAD(P)/FAD-dependent oxidoreductase [Clostridia bacterium]
MKVVVIGGGPAGMMAAITSAKKGNDVTLLEKNSRCGKKLLITGKGRCNITSSLDMSEFINNIPGNGRFLYSCFENFTNEDILQMLHKNNVDTKEERGNRIFPVSDKSIDVLNAFESEIRRANVKLITDAKVTDIVAHENEVKAVRYIKNDRKEEIKAEKVILATGGKSYPITGSTGDGYEIAKKLGHTVEKLQGSLVPLTAKNESLNVCKELQGLSLKNVGVTLVDKENSKVIYKDFGEMLFTHFGVSGPIILSSSAHLLRYKNIEEKFLNNQIELLIDLKPALSEEKLDERIQRDFNKYKNKEIRNGLDELLPKKLILPIIELSKIDINKKINSITKEERRCLVKILKNMPITVNGFRPIEEAIITAGGISIKEINPKTMESKIVNGLYFAGEIIDVDAYTGGFNLQIAYSTGYTAGK